MSRSLMILPILALLPWIACNEQPGSPAAQEGDLQPQGLPQQQESVAQTVEGMLTKIDADMMLIWVRAADGSERSFSYSDLTLVTGVEDSVEGLGKMTGARLRIWYAPRAEGDAAAEIEILSAQTKDPADREGKSNY